MPAKSWGFPLIACLTLVAVFTLSGCSDDDDPVDPGTPDDPSIVGVVISPDEAMFRTIGENIQFRAEAFDAQGAGVDTVFTWQSSNANVVTVDSDGTAVATGMGTAEIYAMAGDVTDTAAVTVDIIGVPIVEWTAGGDGDWHDGANWSSGEVPGLDDFAIINAPGTYTVTLATGASVQGLLLGHAEGTQTLATGSHGITFVDGGLTGGAVLDNDGDSILLGRGVWAAGEINGSGIFTVGQNATLSVTGEALDLNSNLLNSGTLRHMPGSSLRVKGGNLDNAYPAVIELQGDALVSVQEGGIFRNYGSVEKTEGLEEAAILASSATFISEGYIEVDSGALWISGGELKNVVDIAAGTKLRQSGSTIIPSIITRGDGIFEITGRVDFGDFEGQTISLDNVILDSGSYPAMTGLARVRIDGSLVWKRGIIGELNEFITQVGSVTTFETNGTKGLSGTTWLVIGEVQGDSNVDLTLHNNAGILVEPLGKWSQSTGGIIREGLDGSQGMNIQGAFEKTDTGTFVVETRYDCSGTMDLRSGNLAVKGEFRLLESGLITGGSSEFATTEARLTVWEAPSAEMEGTLRPGLGDDLAYFILNGLVSMESTFRLELDMPIIGDFPTEKLICLKNAQTMGGTLTVNVMAPPPAGVDYQVVELSSGRGAFEEIVGAEPFIEVIQDARGVLMRR